jgi:hypothetical protein
MVNDSLLTIFYEFLWFLCPPIFLFRDFLKFIFGATVFEIECCAFGDAVRTN